METKRLVLRNWEENDALDLYEMCLDDSLIKSGIDSFDSVADSLNSIRIWMNTPGFKAIVNKENNCFLGMICLGDMNRYNGYMELEYAIAEKYRNKGYATEAINCMIDYGFSTLNLSAIAAWYDRITNQVFMFWKNVLLLSKADLESMLAIKVILYVILC